MKMEAPREENCRVVSLAKVAQAVALHFGTCWRKTAILKGFSLRFKCPFGSLFRCESQARRVRIFLFAILSILAGYQGASQDEHKPAEAATQ